MSIPVNPLAKLKLQLQTNILLGPRGFRGFPGDRGDPGPYTSIEVAGTETLPTGETAYVNVTQLSPSRIALTFGIPEGPIGEGQGNVFAPASAAQSNIAVYGVDRKQLEDSGVSIDSIPVKTGTFVAGRIPIVNAQGELEDSGKLASNVVIGPSAAGTNRIALFSDPTGKNLKDSGVIIGQAASLNVGQSAGTVAAGNDSRFLDIGRNDSAFALEFADIRGQRFGMRGGYSDSFKLLDGVIMPNGGNDSNTISLLQFEAPTGKRVVQDNAYRDATTGRPRHIWTMMGNAQVSSSQKKFGASSLYLDSSANTALVGDGSTEFQFAGDFDISMWIYRSVVNVAQTLYDSRTTSTQLAILLDITAANVVRYYLNGSAQITGAITIPVNTWTHIRLARLNGLTRLFINGVADGVTGTNTGTYLNSATNGPVIGAAYTLAGLFNGYIDEIRIHKNPVSLDNFTPPDAPYGDGTSKLFGQLYDAALALFKPKLQGDVYTSLLGTRTGTAVATTRTDRIVIPASFVRQEASRIAVRFRSWTAAVKEISNVFVGHKAVTGNAWDMDPATITRLTFNNGQNNLAQAINGSPTLSDWIVFPLDPARDLVISMEYGTAASAIVEAGTTNTLIQMYTKVSALDAGVAAPASFVAATAGVISFVDMIFGKTTSQMYQNMVIDGSTVQAATAPTVIRGAVQYTDPDLTAVPNTDFAMDVSRDNGTTWVNVPLALTQIINNIYTYEGLADMSATPSGTTIKYRTRNPGGKLMPVSGVVVQGK